MAQDQLARRLHLLINSIFNHITQWLFSPPSSSAISLRLMVWWLLTSSAFLDSRSSLQSRTHCSRYLAKRKRLATMPPSWCVTSGATMSEVMDTASRRRMSRLARLSQLVAKRVVPSVK